MGIAQSQALLGGPCCARHEPTGCQIMRRSRVPGKLGGVGPAVVVAGSLRKCGAVACTCTLVLISAFEHPAASLWGVRWGKDVIR